MNPSRFKEWYVEHGEFMDGVPEYHVMRKNWKEDNTLSCVVCNCHGHIEEANVIAKVPEMKKQLESAADDFVPIADLLEEAGYHASANTARMAAKEIEQLLAEMEE